MSDASREPSVPELLRTIAEQGQVFVKAELELLKRESKDAVTRAAVALTVIVVSGLLLAIALSMVAAAIALALEGSPTTALLMAAGVDALVAATAVIIVLRWATGKSADVEASAPQLTKLPQHGNPVS